MQKKPILAIAPMLDVTDRHCRYFLRLLSSKVTLYTEMVTTGAILFGVAERYLRHHAAEQPLVLQLGGSDAAALAKCTKIAWQYGYRAVNLNCGCPSDRVQRGSFGACLMLTPDLVADCVKAMQDAAPLHISVKHRIGVDKQTEYGFVRDFVGTVSAAGCRHFDVHARSAWLQGLSPKQNRQVPPLDYASVYRLKKDFPELTIVLNGGVTSTAQITEHLSMVDGVMIGRQAYHDCWWLAGWDEQFFAANPNLLEREQVMRRYMQYMVEQHTAYATPWTTMLRPVLGLYLGQPGARKWRRTWSNHLLNELTELEIKGLLDEYYRQSV